MDFYLLFKSLHIISFTAWMAGLFYLPRLFVYHSEESHKSLTYKKFILMEKRLLLYIMNPSMLLTWIFGILLFLINSEELYRSPWFLIKLLLVLILSGYQGFLSVCRKKFASNLNNKSSSFYRIINEIPTLILILVVILVVFKPNF